MSQIIYKNGQQCYPVNGKYYPRCTSVLEVFYRKLYGNPDPKMKEFMTERAAIGTGVHKLIELVVHGEPILDEHKIYKNGEVYRYFLQAKSTIEEWRDSGKIVHSEVRVYSHKFMFAGTADLIIEGTVPNTYRLVDVKTAKRNKTAAQQEGYWLQLAAYAMAAKETLGLKIVGADVLFLLEHRCSILSIETDDLVKYCQKFVKIRNEYWQKYGL